jgi:hypothetical protein
MGAQVHSVTFAGEFSTEWRTRTPTDLLMLQLIFCVPHKFLSAYFTLSKKKKGGENVRIWIKIIYHYFQIKGIHNLKNQKRN